MKKARKLALLTLTALFMLGCFLGLVACGGVDPKQAIEMYMLPQAETLVDTDFSLPKAIGKDNAVEVEWKSSKPEAITIEEGDATNYNAKVTLQSEVTDVTLTISAGGASKDFTVRVDELSVYTFLKNYKFAQRGTAVDEGFDLETTTTFQGETATIAWAIDADKYGDTISLNAEKNHVNVVVVDEIVEVAIEATFTYKDLHATQKYLFSVAPPLEHRQLINRIYSQEGYPVKLSGYIAHVYDAKDDTKYGPNSTFYMLAVDDEGNVSGYGYYMYQIAIAKADIEKMVPGAFVTVSGDKAKLYHGLWETNGGEKGTAVVDTTKEKIDPRQYVYALDNDLLSDAPSMIWHQSTFVSLSGWKVQSKAESKPTAADSNLFTLKRGEKEVTVRISKYVQRTAEELTALCNVYDSVEVGDFVNVTGLLGNYDAIQIQPVTASDIVKVDSEGTTDPNAAKVKAAVEEVNTAVASNFASLIVMDKDVTMPTSEDGVTISYHVAGKRLANPVTVQIKENGKFEIRPIEGETKTYDIEVTYSIGDYKAYSFFQIKNLKANPSELVQTVKDALEEEEIGNFYGPGQVDLPSVDDLGTTITWSVDNASTITWAKIANGKLTIAPMPAQTTRVKVIAAVSIGDVSQNAEFEFDVIPGTFKTLQSAPTEGGDYYFSVMNHGKILYATGTELTSSGYLSTTDNFSKAVKLTLVQSSSNWQIKLGTKFLEVEPYKNGTKADASYRLRLVDTATANAVWEWDDTMKLFKQKPQAIGDIGATVENAYFYIGMRDNATFDTMSPSNVSYITGNNESNRDVIQHPARFGNPPFTALASAPVTGTYKLAMYNNTDGISGLYYATGAMDGYYLATSLDPSKAATYTITKIGDENKYTIQVNNKYLEVIARTNGSKGTNVVMNENQTQGKYWTWIDEIKNFVCVSQYNDTEDANKTDEYYLGNYSTNTTLSPNQIYRIANAATHVPNNAEGVSQWVAHFGSIAE